MKKALLLLAAIAGTLTLSAQSSKGGIDAKLLGEISKGYEGTAADKALRNALNVTDINTLALNAGRRCLCIAPKLSGTRIVIR